ncbi:uncharacterized protein UBRO_01836 [Ustilago bromivora]|uniref:Barwin domain-containing protein n=1 Tax=Ustilago bromivora TaxID=307758 RepID=A0A1K0FZX1_9BASI|nr:uncharacterized protein UBRO_01836 [Ustilago bromivora]SYW84373.1 uncharacterized protein UBRO2_05473 [Ustilago bromivora]
MIASNVLAVALAVAGAAAAPLAKRSSGQATYYAAGLGACGWVNSGSDFIVAMNAPEWAGGSRCGQTVTITNHKNGNTQSAQIADLCPGCSYGSLDMSTSLFAALNNGNMDDGVFPISWSFGSGSAASNNNQQQHQQQQQQQKTSSTYTPEATYTKSVEASATATPAQATYSPAAAATTPTASYAPQPASASNTKTVVSTPLWWSDIPEVNSNCGVNLGPASLPIAISSSKLLAADKLNDACGKWVQVKNNQNGKQISVQVVGSFVGSEGDIALTEAYRHIANNYENPENIESITWGFIDGQSM